MPVTQKKHARASDYVFEIVVEDIMSGTFEPGSRLTEAMLIERSGMGRGPIREALNRLEERGLLLREPDFSCRISAFTDADILEMIQVRAALEALASRLAAEHATQEQLDGIRHHLEKRAKEVEHRDPSESLTEIDLGFHDRVALASGNMKLIKILCQDFYNTLRIWRRHQKKIVSNPERDAEEHLKILEAIESREPEIAEFLMRRHINRIWKNYSRVLAVVDNEANDRSFRRRERKVSRNRLSDTEV